MVKQNLHHFLNGFNDTTIFLALVIWLCIVPFVLLFTLTFFGWQGSLTAAVITLFLALALCWGVCFYPKIVVKEK